MIAVRPKKEIGGLALSSYAVVCVVWGSTYLAIRIGVQHMPPALLGAFRFLSAGALLLVVALLLGQRFPRRAVDWRTNAIVGVLLLGLANGLVIWAEQYIHSGAAAIFVVTVSLWMALFDAIIPGSAARPTLVQIVGLVAGFAGTIALVGEDLTALRAADWRGPLALTVASAVWALGSVISQRRPTTSGSYVNSALQMLAGGTALILAGTLRGEWSALQFTWTGFGAVAYLALFGSIIGFTAYVYVLRNIPATVAGTYVYVNTVVAVFLGWLVLGEPITDRTTFAMIVVMAAVMLVRRSRKQRHPKAVDDSRSVEREPDAAASIAKRPAAVPVVASDGCPER
jgi:drug/metabolite transporter (DMT)-like permease